MCHTFVRPWPGSTTTTTTTRKFHYSWQRLEVGRGGSIPGGRRHGHGEMERARPPCHSAGFMFFMFFLFLSFPSGSGGCEEKRDLIGPSATNGSFDLPPGRLAATRVWKDGVETHYFQSSLLLLTPPLCHKEATEQKKKKNRVGAKKEKRKKKTTDEKSGKNACVQNKSAIFGLFWIDYCNFPDNCRALQLK